MQDDEERVAQYLAKRCLSTTRFSKEEQNQGKTPDFRVQAAGGFAFYCEVKSIKANQVQGLQDDPVFNRLTNDIHTAVKQFDAVNQVVTNPNVLALVNHDKMCGFLDLIAVLTGLFMAEDDSHPIYMKFSEGRIKEEKSRIHAFIWLDDFKPERVLFTQSDPTFHGQLCDWLQMQSSEVVQVGA